jgi:hypothetical protein
MDWQCGSNSKVPALQMQSPEFKPQFHWKKKKRHNERARKYRKKYCIEN